MALSISEKAKKIKPSSTLAVTAKAKELKDQGVDIVGFGAGEPDFDTPDHIKEAAIQAISEGFTKYTPVAGILPLKQVICKKLLEENKLAYQPNQIVISNGAKHSLTNIFMAILNPQDEVLIPAPYWVSYPEMVALADGVPVIVRGENNPYKVDVSDLEKVLTKNTRALIINSPSNPTGVVYTREELSAIADFAVKNDLYVISDEIYEKLIYDDIEQVSIASFNEEIYKRTIVVNGVAKSYAMTGWRIGYTASSKELADLMTNIQSHNTSNANSIAQKAAIAAIGGSQECVAQMKEAFVERKDYIYERISRMPYVSAVKPQGAFYVFIDFSEVLKKEYKGQPIVDADQLAQILLEDYRTAVVSCTDFGFPDHIRLSYAISKENIAKGIDRIESFLNSL